MCATWIMHCSNKSGAAFVHADFRFVGPWPHTASAPTHRTAWAPLVPTLLACTTPHPRQAYFAACTPEFYVFDKDLKLTYHGQVLGWAGPDWARSCLGWEAG